MSTAPRSSGSSAVGAGSGRLPPWLPDDVRRVARAARRAWQSGSIPGHRSRARLRLDVEVRAQLAEVAAAVTATRPARAGVPTFDDLAMALPPHRRARLDVDDLDESTLDDDERTYRRDGFLIKPGLIPAELTDAYLRDRLDIVDEEFSVWGGSYMALASMRDICLHPPLFDLVEKLIGKPLALYLTLSGLRSSRREWHQDFYLKPGYEHLDYCAVWIALDDVHPDSGPYEYIPGSHRLPTLRYELVHEWLTPDERAAVGSPRIAESFVTGACEAMIRERGLEVRQFLPRRGDVLVWHHSLLHQGSRPKDPSIVRPGLIAHYNAVSVFEQARKPIQAAGGGRYVIRSDQHDVLSRRRAAQPLVDASRRGRARMGRSAHADSPV
jgi:hypothetical protein